jgi:cell filamentation protein
LPTHTATKAVQCCEIALGLRDQAALDAFETEATAQRSAEPLPVGRLSVSHYCAVHRHLFGDVYPWAGQFRTVRIAKGGSMFCYPENIGSEMRRVFGKLRAAEFLRGLEARPLVNELTHFLTELNAIHAFRDGNGRTQLAFAGNIAFAAGWPLHATRIDPEAFLAAMIESFQGREQPLRDRVRELL